jgi:hypothetical protein|tara:strand:- start:68 stop:310 length:243 start_codon:yes stop_codon:yes gene_type:complete
MSFIPTTTSASNINTLRNWVSGELLRISNALSKTDIEISVINAAPAKPQRGQVIFADGTNFNPGNGRGLYYYDTAWIKIA